MFTQRPTDRVVFIGNPAVTVTTTKKQTAAANWWESAETTGARWVHQSIGAATYAASLLDLSGNGNHATEGVAPSWSALDGWTVNGSTQYLLNNVIPAQGNFCIVRFSNAVGGGIVIGARGDPRFYFWANDPENSNYGNAAMGGTPNSFSGGVFAWGENIAYYNGVALTGLNATTWSGSLTYGFGIGALNRGSGTITNFLNGKIQACALYTSAPSAPQVIAVSTAMEAL